MAFGDVIARLAVNLTLETAAFEKGASISEKRLAQMQRSFSKMGDQITGIGQKMSIGLSAPLAAFGASAFKAASDAAEMQSAFNQTFGDMAADMNAWAEATGDAMGRSTQELQRAANAFGIFFNQAAPTREEAAKMSQVFTVLAQDLASFYNVAEGEALQKLRSGLSGESEPLRDFGVFLTEATVKAKAMELGLVGVGNELTEQEKIMARYALILEQTQNAQGDVARTSDGTANKMRETKAAFEELQVVVGTKLLPALTPLIEKLGAALTWFSSLPEPVQETALIVAGLSAAIGPLLIGLGSIISAIGVAMPVIVAIGGALATVSSVIVAGVIPALAGLIVAMAPILLPLAAVAAAVGAVYLAWKNWDKITAFVRNLYQGVKTWLQDKLGKILDWVREKVAMVEGAFRWLWDRVVGNSWVPDMVDGIAAHMARLDAVMVDPARKAAQATSDAMREMARDTHALLDRLFPEIGRAAAYARDLALIDSAGLSDDQATEARRRLSRERRGVSPGSGANAPVSEALLNTPSLAAGINEAWRETVKLGEKAQTATVRVAKSFKDMAEDTMGAIRRMTDAIKGGGFLNILESVLGLGMQLGSIGVFGKQIAANINRPVPGYATGTSSAARGLAMVGERGPELVQFRGGERVFNNADTHRMVGGRGGNIYHINGNLLTPEFWERINAGDQMAAANGAGMAHSQAAKAGQWRLGQSYR